MFISCLLDQLEIDRSFLSVLFTPIITIFLILWTWSWDTKLNTLDTNEQDDIINQWEWWISCYGMVNLNIMGHLNVAWKRGIHCIVPSPHLLDQLHKNTVKPPPPKKVNLLKIHIEIKKWSNWIYYSEKNTMQCALRMNWVNNRLKNWLAHHRLI